MGRNNLNCPSRGEKGKRALFVWDCVLQFPVVLCKWTDISILWKEQSRGWREQVKISLWIISPPRPGHCSCTHTWQRRRERILLFRPKPVLLVYRLKRGKRGGIFWWKAGPLWQPSSCVPAEKALWAEAAAVPTTCRVLSAAPPLSAGFLWALGDSAEQVQFRLMPREGKKKEGHKKREKINFLSGIVEWRGKEAGRYILHRAWAAPGSGFWSDYNVLLRFIQLFPGTHTALGVWGSQQRPFDSGLYVLSISLCRPVLPIWTATQVLGFTLCSINRHTEFKIRH